MFIKQLITTIPHSLHILICFNVVYIFILFNQLNKIDINQEHDSLKYNLFLFEKYLINYSIFCVIIIFPHYTI